MQKMPQLRDVATDQQNHGLEARVVIDRETASRLGVTTQAIDSTLYDAFGQRQVSVMYSGINHYHRHQDVHPKFPHSPRAPTHILVPSPNRHYIPLHPP